MNDTINIMAKDWIHRKNGDFFQQAQSFSALVNLDPAKYSVSTEEAALLAAEFAEFAARYNAAAAPSTRTSLAIRARNQARKQLADRMRDLGGRIRANRALSNHDKFQLSIAIPKRANQPLVALPANRPKVVIRSLVSNVLTLVVRDSVLSRIAKPEYVTGAELFYATGDHAPADGADWQRGCITMSSKATVFLPVVPPGTKVWICARWFNTHGAGPISDTIYTHVGQINPVPGALGFISRRAA